MIRRLAWCETNRSRSSGVRRLRSSSAPRDFLRLAHGELEHRLAVLLDVVQPLVDRLVRRRPQAAAGGHAQRRTAAAVDFVLEVEDAAVALAGRRDDDGAGAVAEQDARRRGPCSR